MSKRRFVSGDNQRRVQPEKMLVTFFHCPGEGAVADVDGIQVRTDPGRVDRVLGIGDTYVDRYSGYKT